MTSTAGTGTETADVVDAPTGDAHGVTGLVVARHLEALRPGPGQRRHHDRVPRRRDPRPPRRERLRQVDAAEHRQRQPRRPTAAPSRSPVSGCPRRRRGPRCSSGSAWRISTSPPSPASPSPRTSSSAHPTTSDPPTRRCTDGRPRSSPSYELDVAAAARIETLSAAQLQMLEVVSALLPQPKVLLLDEPTTALGHADVQRLHALIRNLAAQRDRRRVRQPPPARGARRRRPRHRPARRRQSGHLRRAPRCRRPTSWR